MLDLPEEYVALIAGLSSASEDGRRAAAAALDDLGPGWWEGYFFPDDFSVRFTPALLRTYAASSDPGVRSWVIRLLTHASQKGAEVVSCVAEALAPQDPCVEDAARYVWFHFSAFDTHRDRLAALVNHPSVVVRRSVAGALRNLPLRYERDVRTIHALLYDKDHLVRLEGVSAMRVLGLKSEDDQAAVQHVVDVGEPDDAARCYALQWREELCAAGTGR